MVAVMNGCKIKEKVPYKYTKANCTRLAKKYSGKVVKFTASYAMVETSYGHNMSFHPMKAD